MRIVKDSVREEIGGEYYVFRDAVHTLIAVDDEVEGKALRSLLRTFELQRLRRIRQNGLSFLVYSSMENSRFAHVLGTYAVARRLIDSLVQREPETSRGFPTVLRLSSTTRNAFCVAALLHDIGHAPFSHVWEEFFEHRYSQKYGKPAKFKLHEEMGKFLVRSTTHELGKELRRNTDHPSYAASADEVCAFLEGTHRCRYLLPLLAGHLDVDRLDFLGRDTRAAGVTYGFHELDWIIRSLRFAPRHTERGSEWVVAIDGRKGLGTLRQFLLARWNMYEQVYLHKTVRAAGKMLLHILERAASLAENGALSPPAALRACLLMDTPSPELIANYFGIDDSDIWVALKQWQEDAVGDGILRELSSGLLQRRLFKVIELPSKSVHDQLKKSTTLLNNICFSRLRAIFGLKEINEARFFYALDCAHFDLIGDPRSDESGMLVLGGSAIGPTFQTLRKFWTDDIGGDVAARDRYFLVAHEGVYPDLRRIVDSLVGFATSSIEPPISPPARYHSLAKIQTGGAFKDVYIGVARDPGSTSNSLVALKHYRDTESKPERDVYRPNLLSTTSSQFLSRSETEKSEGSDALWVVEQLWNGTLDDYPKNRTPIRDVALILRIGFELFSGLEALHRSNLRHTDLKPDNCGVVHDGEVRYVIGDFGCLSASPDVVPKEPSSLGTIRTRAPEMFETPPRIGLASDVWALGATIYCLLMLKFPFVTLDQELHEQGTPERRGVEQAIAADITAGGVEKFRSRVKSEVPPLISSVLLQCFSDMGSRAKAGVIARAFETALDALSGKGTTHSEERWAWRRHEALRDLSDSSAAQSELDDLATRLSEFVPPPKPVI